MWLTALRVIVCNSSWTRRLWRFLESAQCMSKTSITYTVFVLHLKPRVHHKRVFEQFRCYISSCNSFQVIQGLPFLVCLNLRS